MLCVRAGLYLCETLIGSDRVDLHILALLDEPQVGIVGLVVVHVKRLPRKEKKKTTPMTLQAAEKKAITS